MRKRSWAGKQPMPPTALGDGNMNRGIFSKFTFGFVMAQLFPGVVAVSSVFLALVMEKTPKGLINALKSVWEYMFSEPAWGLSYPE